MLKTFTGDRLTVKDSFWISIIIALIGWVLFAGYITNIEYSDGYISIANSQYILGETQKYFGQRVPFMAVWLIPAELN